jgi:hypothetical protein
VILVIAICHLEVPAAWSFERTHGARMSPKNLQKRPQKVLKNSQSTVFD